MAWFALAASGVVVDKGYLGDFLSQDLGVHLKPPEGAKSQ